MKNEAKRGGGDFALAVKYALDILLLLVNSIGIVGAMTEILEIPWKQNTGQGLGAALDGGLFWAGVVFLCVAVIFLRRDNGWNRIILRIGICAILYIMLGVIFHKELAAGIAMGLENAVSSLNERYEFHIVWASGLTAGLDAGQKIRLTTLSFLYALFPLELLAGILGKYCRIICLVAGHALWFFVACILDVFPGYCYLIFCVLGVVGVLVRKEFERNLAVGVPAVFCAMGFSGAAAALVLFGFLPAMDREFETVQEKREAFYQLVNEVWIPEIQSVFSGYGFGSGPGVTGNLGRKNLFAYTGDDVYRVTVKQIPEGTLYLKGFVGALYDSEAWVAQADSDLENYYQKHMMELPENFGDLVNISYEAAASLNRDEVPGEIQIEETRGRSNYSIYPYGALLPESFQVNGDGSVAWKSREYGFQYHFLSGFGRGGSLSGDWEETEIRYRKYVYDNFLEYPEEKLPRLTEGLDRQGIRTDDIYTCALDIMNFLSERAVYDLDAENNPPESDFVEYFLFDSHVGYCMHFASAGVLAFRYFGMPARYVAGYTVSPSDFSANGDGTYTAVITGRQAHAWSEIYLDSIGWVPVEMTPGAVAFPEDNRMEQLVQVGQLSGLGLFLNENARNPERPELGAGEVPVSSRNPQREEVQDNRPEEDDKTDTEKAESGEVYESEQEGKNPAVSGNDSEPDDFEEKPDKTVLRFALIVFSILAVFAVAAAVRRVMKERRREIFRRAGVRERIYLLYQSLRKVLQAAGCSGEWAVDEDEFWQGLQRVSGQVTRQEYDMFCGILEKNTFGGEEPSEMELREVYAFHDRLVGEIYGQANVLRKLQIKWVM